MTLRRVSAHGLKNFEGRKRRKMGKGGGKLVEENVGLCRGNGRRTLLETIETVDVKDPFVWGTLVREWIGDGYYRSVRTRGIPTAPSASELAEVGEEGR